MQKNAKITIPGFLTQTSASKTYEKSDLLPFLLRDPLVDHLVDPGEGKVTPRKRNAKLLKRLKKVKYINMHICYFSRSFNQKFMKMKPRKGGMSGRPKSGGALVPSKRGFCSGKVFGGFVLGVLGVLGVLF